MLHYSFEQTMAKRKLKVHLTFLWHFWNFGSNFVLLEWVCLFSSAKFPFLHWIDFTQTTVYNVSLQLVTKYLKYLISQSNGMQNNSCAINARKNHDQFWLRLCVDSSQIVP